MGTPAPSPLIRREFALAPDICEGPPPPALCGPRPSSSPLRACASAATRSSSTGVDDAGPDDLLQIIGERYPTAEDLLATCPGRDRPALRRPRRAPARGDRTRRHDGPAPTPAEVAPTIAALPFAPEIAARSFAFAPLDHAAVVAAVAHRDGGFTTFVGDVRDHSQGGPLTHLDDEAFGATAHR